MRGSSKGAQILIRRSGSSGWGVICEGGSNLYALERIHIKKTMSKRTDVHETSTERLEERLDGENGQGIQGVSRWTMLLLLILGNL